MQTPPTMEEVVRVAQESDESLVERARELAAMAFYPKENEVTTAPETITVNPIEQFLVKMGSGPDTRWLPDVLVQARDFIDRMNAQHSGIRSDTYSLTSMLSELGIDTQDDKQYEAAIRALFAIAAFMAVYKNLWTDGRHAGGAIAVIATNMAKVRNIEL